MTWSTTAGSLKRVIRGDADDDIRIEAAGRLVETVQHVIAAAGIRQRRRFGRQAGSARDRRIGSCRERHFVNQPTGADAVTKRAR
jgi:hypothetical protein